MGSPSCRGLSAVDKNRPELPDSNMLSVRLVGYRIPLPGLRKANKCSLASYKSVTRYISAPLCGGSAMHRRSTLSLHLNQSILERLVVRIQSVFGNLCRTLGSLGGTTSYTSLPNRYTAANNRTYSEHRGENDHASLQASHPFLDRNIALSILLVALLGLCLLTLYVIYATAYKYSFRLKAGSCLIIGIVGGQVATYFILKLLLG